MARTNSDAAAEFRGRLAYFIVKLGMVEDSPCFSSGAERILPFYRMGNERSRTVWFSTVTGHPRCKADSVIKAVGASDERDCELACIGVELWLCQGSLENAIGGTDAKR